MSTCAEWAGVIRGMVDTLSVVARSERMSRIRSGDTEPELMVRRLVHRMGYRYRLHGADLPGKPDLVFRSRKKVIFVHGCFWHRHTGCSLARIPKSRVEFWRGKLEQNRTRDIKVRRRLARMGWKSLVVWECKLNDLERVCGKIERFLGASGLCAKVEHI